jgi:hypothetical protein
MRDSDFLRRQAEHCIALSRATIDLTVAGRLRAMAAEFRAKAAEWESQDPDESDQPSSNAGRPGKGQISRN